jgi:DNA-binding MarR family transcriptional regulator
LFEYAQTHAATSSNRRVEHALTKDGERMLAAGLEVSREISERAFAGLTAAEVKKLHDLLERVGEVPE